MLLYYSYFYIFQHIHFSHGAIWMVALLLLLFWTKGWPPYTYVYIPYHISNHCHLRRATPCASCSFLPSHHKTGRSSTPEFLRQLRVSILEDRGSSFEDFRQDLIGATRGFVSTVLFSGAYQALYLPPLLHFDTHMNDFVCSINMKAGNRNWQADYNKGSARGSSGGGVAKNWIRVGEGRFYFQIYFNLSYPILSSMSK